jgi:hypothetical protein
MNTFENHEPLSFAVGEGEVKSIEDFLEPADLVPPVITPSEEEIEITEILDLNPPEPKTPPPTTEAPEAILGSPYKEMVDKMVSMGKWVALETIVDENGNEVAYEDANIDEDTFNQIVELQEETKKGELLANKIDIDKTSDLTRKLIDIEKNGGNIRQALDAYDKVISPLDSLDVTSEEGQSEILKMKFTAQGIAEDVISTIIDGFKAKEVLGEKAEEAVNEFHIAFDKHVEYLNSQAIIQKEEAEKALQNYRKDLKEIYSTSYELNDATQKKLLDVATKKKDGKFEVDTLYNERRKDPKTAADLTLYLTDPEEFLKQKFKDFSRNKELSTLKTLNLVKKSGDSIKLSVQGKGSGKELSLEELIDK